MRGWVLAAIVVGALFALTATQMNTGVTLLEETSNWIEEGPACDEACIREMERLFDLDLIERQMERAAAMDREANDRYLAEMERVMRETQRMLNGLP